MRSINIFSRHPFWSLKLTPTEQILTTRLCFIFLFISLIVTIICISRTIRTYDVTLKQFTLADFERLNDLYPSTINVPCTQVSIPHYKFLQLTPKFHQICSSSLIELEWVSSLFVYNTTSQNILDFHTFTVAQFRGLKLLCQTAHQAMSNGYHTFMSTNLVTSHALSRTQFNQITAGLINNFKRHTIVNERRTLKTILMNMAHDRLLSALHTNPYVQSESRSYECFSQASDFYNRTIGKSSIPGLMTGCLPLDSIRQSTFECFYNQSCITSLILRSNLSQAKALDIALTRFPLNTTIGSIFDQFLFIESWFDKTDFSQYFTTCAPRFLIYRDKQRLNIISLITIFIIIFGGLFIIWEMLTPTLVKFWSRINRKQEPPNQSIIALEQISRNTDTIIHSHQRKYIFNLFPPDDPNNVEEDHIGIFATRIYILLLLIGILILILYFCLVKHTQTHTISYPTESQYEQLKSLHSSTLVCPCSRVSTSYARIMSITPHYHQICSNELFQKFWLLYFEGIKSNKNKVNFISPDFRISGQSFINLLKIFCQTSKDIVEDALHVFRSNRFVTINILSHEKFNREITNRLKKFQYETIISFVNLIDLIRTSIHTNHLISEKSINTRNFFTNSCSCDLSSQCTRPLGFYYQSDNISSTSNFTIPGLVIGCYPIDSIFLSTLECFYEWQCLKHIINMYDFDVVGKVRSLDQHTVNIQPLSQEMNTRFSVNTTIESIISQLFIEDWSASKNFSAYYEYCASKQCTYKVQEHYNIIFILTIIFGFIGGFSAILETILPWIVRRIRRQRQQEDDLTITPRNSIGHISTQTLYQRFLPFRICLLVFSISIFVTIVYFILFTNTTKDKIIKSSSSNFQYDLYSGNILSCPCSNSIVPHTNIISIDPQYHPICSSELVSSSYWSQLYNKGDRISLLRSTHYQLLSSMCDLTKRFVENVQYIFSSHQLISPETMIRPLFMNQTETLVASFIDQTLSDYNRTLSFIINSFKVNQINFRNNMSTKDCIEHNCLPFDGFRLIKFQNTSLGELNNKLFVKEWHYRTDYLTYYHLICRPTKCQIMQFNWNNLLYISIIAISLYGGLTYGLHLIMGQTLRDCCK